MGLKTKIFIAALSALMLGTGCSKSSSSGDSPSTPTSTALTISGSLGIGASGSTQSKIGSFKASSGNVNALSSKFSTASYRVACVTLETVPQSCGGDVAADGAFSVSCDGFAGKPFGCFVFHKTSFATYPIVFNVSGSEEKTIASNSGTISATIVVDTETGTAKASATLPTGSTGSTGISATLADIQMLEGNYKMGPAAWSDVSSYFTTEDSSILTSVIQFGVNANQCPAGSTPVQENMGWSECSFLPTSAQQAYNFRTCEFMSHDGSCFSSVVTNGDYVAPTADQINSGGEAVYFSAVEDANGKLFMGAWQSESARNVCGSSPDLAPTWKISNGTTDVSLDFSGSTSSTLISSLETSLNNAITSYSLGMLNDIGQSGGSDISSGDVVCKYAVDLDPGFWNVSPEAVTACQSESGCSSLSGGGDFDRVMRYRMGALYAGTDVSSAVAGIKAIFGNMVDLNFSDNSIADNDSNYTVKYGTWGGWDSVNNKPSLVAVSDPNSVIRLDLGGCVQWNNSGNPTIVPVGDYIEYVMPDGSKMQDKCRYSENRLVVQDDSGYLVVSDVKYKEVTLYLEANADSSIQKQTWTKACEITYNSSSMVQFFPVDMTSNDIVTEFNSRRNGGTAEDKAGMKFGILYELIAGRDIGEQGINDSESFYGFDGSNSFQLKCSEIVAGAATNPTRDATAVWNQIGSLFDRPFNGPHQLAKVFSCALIGIQSGVYTGQTGLPTGVEGQAAFADGNSNNIPDIFDSLKTNSCMPQFQMTRICTKEGCGEPKVICNSVTAANGGCDNADPSGRHALLKVTPLGNGRYDLFNKDERYDFYYDPENNSGKQCTRTELMTITNQTAATSTVATGASLFMQFAMSETKVCDGETGEAGAAPKTFMQFVKQ